jgi:hypothetical protein
MPQRKKRPRDLSLLARSIVEDATGEKFSESEEEFQEEIQKNPHAVELGRLGGLKGGLISASKLTREERREKARKAAKARWAKRAGND